MSEHDQRHGTRRRDAELETEQRPRTPLQLHVPNDVGEFAIRRFVEGIISELKQSPVGVEYTSTTLLGTKRTQYIAQDSGTTFQKRLYDPRLGWREESVRQLTVQDELVARLTLDRPVEDGQWARRRDCCRLRPIDVLRRR
ncbi:hypothetical protein MBEHAL_2205 [Halarchaeum acidiphilum MH1-52-1]|uniref:DUF8030 domain-containing protein n=1 Tax=Halarchaeum acidiphilum MH1-52-1 TaxID=1261545 RepID=U2YWN5_9EURY|nr:hypothetical protein [Halarchaeum acidiphilum]GAD53445.1 hypothetical protein MBEHAL_2205 [Halarchaeum acidiphilum MH1-52-1]